MTGIRSKLPDNTYLEVVRSLFATLWLAVAMALCFSAVGLLVLRQTPDIRIAALVASGMVAAAARIAVVLRYRETVMRQSLTVGMAHRFERRFALAYFSFAVIFGGFCVAAMTIGAAGTNMIVIGLMFGYCAGVASGLSLRPRISVPGMIAATLPTVIAMGFYPGLVHRALGVLIVVFVAGGIKSMRTRSAITAADITMRHSFARLARSDYLTGLPNRLSLREHFDEFTRAARGSGIIAVHCLDLDRFKPVNDVFGHPAGDAVLQTVAARLLGVIREGDFAARIGGDEFVVVQMRADDAGEAKALARRIIETIAEPFIVDGHLIEIAVSVGYALSSRDQIDLACLVTKADRALCSVKRQGGGIEQYDPVRHVNKAAVRAAA